MQGVVIGRALGAGAGRHWTSALRYRRSSTVAAHCGRCGCTSNTFRWQLGALCLPRSPGLGNAEISTASVTLSFVYENIFLQIASFVPGVLILLAHASLAMEAKGDVRHMLLVAGGAGLAILLAAVLLGPALRFGFARLQKRRGTSGEPPRLLGLAASLRHGLWFIVPRLLNGAGFVLIVGTVAPVAPGDWVVLGAIYVVAGAIGILAVFVPSGLGVREGVIVVLASPVIGANAAILAAILARLIATAADGLVALVAALALWQRQGEIPSSQRDAA